MIKNLFLFIIPLIMILKKIINIKKYKFKNEMFLFIGKILNKKTKKYGCYRY
jgi:hypothetical protein